MGTAPKSPGLIPVPKEVTRAGKTFTQNYWMKPEEAAKKLKDKGFEPEHAGSHVKTFKSLVDEFAGFKGAGELAASMSTSWTSSCKNYEAAQAQGVVAALLGRDPKKLPHVERKDGNYTALLAAAEQAKDPNDKLRKAMIGCYAVTQAALKLAGEPDVMKLTRGVKGQQAAELIAAAKALADAGVHYDDAALSTGFNALSCFTKKDQTSYHGFGEGSTGVTFSLDVPREAVMFSHKSTPGHSTNYVGEEEYTVMCAGPMDLALRNVHGNAGKQIYDYFASKGLTGDQTPKTGAVAAPKVDPLISFKIQGALGEVKMKQAVENAGGNWLGGTGQNVQIKASQVADFVDAFKETPAFDAKVKTPEAMKAWLQSKATQAIDVANAPPGSKSYENGPSNQGWRAKEPETKEVAERIAKALGAGTGVSEALKEKAAQVGAAAASAVDEDVDDDDVHAQLLDDMHGLIPSHKESFGKPANEMTQQEQVINDEAHEKAMEVLAETVDPQAAADAYSKHVKEGLAKLKGPIETMPKMSELKHKGAAIGIGGAGEKHFYEGPDGKKYLVKVAAEKGTGKEAPVKVAAQKLASAVGQAIKPGVSIPIEAGEHAGKLATVQPWLGDKLENLSGVAPESLNAGQKKDVAEEHVIDWLTGQHDSHGGNLVKLPNGKIVGVDKEQALKHVHDDKLSTDYHPNGAVGESPPYYNGFWKGFAAGKVDFDPTVLKGAIEKAEAIPDSVHKAQVAEYAKLQKPGNPAAQKKIVDAALERKKYIRKDFEQFISGHYEKRTGQKGSFSFEGGWKPEGAAGTLTSSSGKTSGEAMAELYSSKKSGGSSGELALNAGTHKLSKWAEPDDEVMSSSLMGSSVQWAANAGVDSMENLQKAGAAKANGGAHHPAVEAANEAVSKHPKYLAGTMTKKEAHAVALKAMKEAVKKAPLEKPASSKAMKPADVEAAKAPAAKKMPDWSNPANFAEGHKIPPEDMGKHAESWAEAHLGEKDDGAMAQALGNTYSKIKGQGPVSMKEAHEEFKKQLDIVKGKPAGTETKVPDVPDAKVKQFFKDNEGKSPPHRKWYWEGWAQAAMNKAGIPKEQHKEIFEKVQAQAKVMLAKHALTGKKVSQDAAKAYIQAQAMKKGADPDVMPSVEPSKEKPKLEKKTHAEAKELHAYLKKKADAGTASPEEHEVAKADPDDVHALKKAMAGVGFHVEAPPKPKAEGSGPEHPYEYYWKTWANKAAKAETGKPAPPEVHAKISGLAKKFIAQKTLANAKFTGKDLEKYIQAAAKKQGEHPGD